MLEFFKDLRSSGTTLLMKSRIKRSNGVLQEQSSCQNWLSQ
jgi:hypothetical protein